MKANKILLLFCNISVLVWETFSYNVILCSYLSLQQCAFFLPSVDFSLAIFACYLPLVSQDISQYNWNGAALKSPKYHWVFHSVSWITSCKFGNITSDRCKCSLSPFKLFFSAIKIPSGRSIGLQGGFAHICKILISRFPVIDLHELT